MLWKIAILLFFVTNVLVIINILVRAIEIQANVEVIIKSLVMAGGSGITDMFIVRISTSNILIKNPFIAKGIETEIIRFF